MDFLNFIVENWRWLICVVAGVLSVIFSIIRRPRVVDSLLSYALEKLPNFIKFYEKPGNGKEKLKLVLSAVILDMAKHSDLSEQEIAKRYGRVLITAVENILSCPQKKEGVI